ncbi:MAG TPA: DciA family protein [Candidatus Saccharimonadia bacterium]
MDSMKDSLRKRADELRLGRADELAEIQAYLDERYAGQCRAASLNDGVLKITTPNASLASELRMGQVAIAQKFKVRIIITIM